MSYNRHSYIRHTGDPVLRKIADPFRVSSLGSPFISKMLIPAMVKAMDDAQGVGLAAPQIGISESFFIYRRPSDGEIIFVANPFIILGYDSSESVEGCLSIPGQEFTVYRYEKIKVSYLNEYGDEVITTLNDLEAIIFQHEYDHLNGILLEDKKSAKV